MVVRQLLEHRSSIVDASIRVLNVDTNTAVIVKIITDLFAGYRL